MIMQEIDIQELLAPDTFRLGSAEDRNGGTGCTVLVFPKSAPCAVDLSLIHI